MRLYEDKVAPNCRRVRVFLAEKGLEVEAVSIDIVSGQNLSGEYLTINPVGQLPTLELDDGTRITESSAICRYFEELHPQPALMGRSPVEKATVDMWERRADFLGMLSVVDNFRNRFPPFSDRAIPGTKGVGQISELVERGRQSTMRFYERLEERLSDSPYLAGQSMTLADIAAMCAVDFALFCELEIPENRPHLRAWYEGMEARESSKGFPGMVGLLGSYSKVVGG